MGGEGTVNGCLSVVDECSRCLPVCPSAFPIDKLAIDVETKRDLRLALVAGSIELVGVDGRHCE